MSSKFSVDVGDFSSAFEDLEKLVRSDRRRTSQSTSSSRISAEARSPCTTLIFKMPKVSGIRLTVVEKYGDDYFKMAFMCARQLPTVVGFMDSGLPSGMAFSGIVSPRTPLTKSTLMLLTAHAKLIASL